jgi:hypothetical protein
MDGEFRRCNTEGEMGCGRGGCVTGRKRAWNADLGAGWVMGMPNYHPLKNLTANRSGLGGEKRMQQYDLDESGRDGMASFFELFNGCEGGLGHDGKVDWVELKIGCPESRPFHISPQPAS